MLKLRDLMTSDVITLSPELTLRDAVAILAEKHVGGAPVVTGRRVVGVVSMTDILDFQAGTEPVPSERAGQDEWGEFEEPSLAESADLEDVPPASFFSELWADAGADVAERYATPGSPEWDVMGEHTVSEAMSRVAMSLPPETAVDAAADVMRREGIHRILVMDGEALLGIVTTMDITRAVADHKLTVRQYVFDRPLGGPSASEWNVHRRS